MASACILEVHPVPSFPPTFTINTPTAPERSQSEPSPTPTEAALTDEECTAILRRWDADIRRAARSAASRFQLDESFADDFAQEARIRLLGAVRRQPSLPEQYLRRVIVNAIQTAVSGTRMSSGHDAIDNVTDELESDADQSSTYTDPLKIAAVADFIRGLPTNLQRVYELLYEQGHTQREAASQLGVAQPRIAQMHRELVSRAQYHLGHLEDGVQLGAA